jgi:hypothetical protein
MQKYGSMEPKLSTFVGISHQIGVGVKQSLPRHPYLNHFLICVLGSVKAKLMPLHTKTPSHYLGNFKDKLEP